MAKEYVIPNIGLQIKIGVILILLVYQVWLIIKKYLLNGLIK